MIEKSSEFQKRLQDIREKANRARSEAAEGNQNAAKEKTVVPQIAGVLIDEEKTPKNKGSIAKAELIDVNRGAVERASVIKNKAPDLAEKVASGEISATAALKEIRKHGMVTVLSGYS